MFELIAKYNLFNNCVENKINNIIEFLSRGGQSRLGHNRYD